LYEPPARPIDEWAINRSAENTNYNTINGSNKSSKTTNFIQITIFVGLN
jgi:hypothetical protein